MSQPDERHEDEPQPSYIMVLNDGETYTNLAGCEIREVPPDDGISGFDLDFAVKDNTLRVVRTFDARPRTFDARWRSAP